MEPPPRSDNRRMPRLERLPFRFRVPVTGRWVRARYKASLANLGQRYGGGTCEITGPPEIREVDPAARFFNPLSDVAPELTLA